VPERIRIAVVFGGRSGEHDVSCDSAAGILANLDPARYDVLPVRITRDGAWSVGDDEPADRLTSLADAVAALRGVDVVFPALHGPYGEDGTLQMLLEAIGLPYVGNGVLASAAGMDKEHTKRLAVAAGLRVADGVVLRGREERLAPEQMDRLGLPVFVKPARAGSSLGVSKVDSWDALPGAVRAARASDRKVLVEAAVPGREIDVAVLEYPDGRLVAGPPLEIRVTGDRTFFDYEAKYTDEGHVFDIPARLDAHTTKALQRCAVRAFRALGCTGLLRADFFLSPAGEPVLNEVNTFPGFTPLSQYPQIWDAAGLPYPALLDVLVETALATRRPGQARRSYTVSPPTSAAGNVASTQAEIGSLPWSSRPVRTK